MTSAETLLACCVVGLACFIGGQTLANRPVRAEAAGKIDARLPRPTDTLATGLTGTTTHNASSARAPRPALSPADLRRRLAGHAEGTYLDELLVARDSVLARWPDRGGRPLRVFIREGAPLEGWTTDFLPAVRDAFDTWTQAGVPLRFVFTTDSVGADVRVRFVDGFPNGISGKTVWSRDANYWLVASEIQLAVTHPAGGFVTPPQMRAIALHEVGHLLGLDHTENPEHIMSPRIRVRELSAEDKATVRLIYSVPAGALR